MEGKDKNGNDDNDNDTETVMIMAISAANGPVDWDAVETLLHHNHHREGDSNAAVFKIHELVLEDFGPIMAQDGFQTALNVFRPILEEELERLQPSVLVASSKGVGIISYLCLHDGLWNNGPVVLLSPIPNACDHVTGGSWHAEWTSTMQVLKTCGDHPMMVLVVGDSVDEQFLITDAMVETEICGDLVVDNDEDDDGAFVFEKCSNWHLLEAHGNHSWKSDPKNLEVIVRAIEKALLLDLETSATTILLDDDESSSSSSSSSISSCYSTETDTSA